VDTLSLQPYKQGTQITPEWRSPHLSREHTGFSHRSECCHIQFSNKFDHRQQTTLDTQ